MRSRSGARLLVILLVALAAFQFAFRPVAMSGRVPVLQAPALRINLGLDLRGGTLLVLEGQDTPTTKATPEAVEAAMRVIQSRIDQLGVAEPTIQRQGATRVIVELPGIADPQRAINLIGKTALLEFVDTGTQALPEGARWSADGKTVTLPGLFQTPAPGQQSPSAGQGQSASGQVIRLEKRVVLTGADLQTAQAQFNQQTAEPVVSFQFRSQAARKFEEYTAANVGKYLTIALDNVVISSPVIRDRIPGGSGQISGGFRTIEEARDLAVLLRGGALPIPMRVMENRTIGPQLGRDSIDASLKASWIAFAGVGLFMLLYYGLSGLMADVALALYLLLVLAALSALGATLTLPGIAGLLLSVGMAVDANIIIFEKMKEELRAGKSLRAATDAGWHRAMSAIIDSNVTAVIAAVILFILGTGPIRGFAVTLSIGVVISMFTAITVTRALVDGAASAGLGSYLARMAGRGQA
ncbi:MAG: protein translocase subunit SecD [Armatimonadota bacterium]|nr:protein translocase subunit SecD [Armatimonadota bacterium]